jgi:PAS domain S-box-containing protein/diguanylate cyclase (GGDEF)-like protein
MLEELDTSCYRDILESLPTGVYVVDRERKILLWNDGAERITGYLRQEVIGRFCPDNLLMHCDLTYQCLCGSECPLLNTMHDGRPREAQLFLRHKNGERVPVRVRSVPLRDAAGSIIGAVETFDEQHPADQRAHPNMQAVQTHIEELTGISDRESTELYLQACVRDFADDRIPFSVLRIAIDDLSGFRKIHGAVAGDRIVHMVAASISKNLREGDIAGHWADDRFIAILLDCPPVSLAQIAAKLKVLIDAAAIPWWGDRICVTISAAGATVRPEDTADSLLSRSEQALDSCLAESRQPLGNDLRESLK